MFGYPKQEQIMDRTMLCVLVVIQMCRPQTIEPRDAKLVLQSHGIVALIPVNWPVIPQQN